MATSAGKNISYGSRHMATLWNPFSYKNNEPKYPDGLAQYSIGRKWTNVTRVRGKEVTIILYPGLLSWCCISNSAPEDSDNPGEFIKGDVHFTRESVGYTFGRTNAATLIPVPGTDPANDPKLTQSVTEEKWTVSKNKFSAWRPVSCALKIKSTNRLVGTCGKNDGWWEAIRTSKMIKPDVFGLESVDTLFPVGSLVPTNAYAKEVNSAQNWSLTPSYSTGSISDLSRWTFQLNQIRNDNDFVDLTDVSFEQDNQFNNLLTDVLPDPVHQLEYPNMQSNPALVRKPDSHYPRVFVRGQQKLYGDSTGILAEEEKPHLTKERGYGSTHSDSLDIIVIKLHGTDESEYLVSSVMNQEFLANDTELKDYQTTSYASKKELEEYLSIRARDYKIPNHTYYNKKKKF